MDFITSYETDEYIAYKGDTMLTLLSAAILPLDDFTKKEAIGHIKVKIKETGKEAIKNPSGYYIFTDLALGQYTFDIFSDMYFFKETELIDISKIRVSNVTLEFDTNGPKKGETSTKLKDVSRLQKDDVVEFRNLSGDVEQKNITNIDARTKTISWATEPELKPKLELKHDFSAAGSAIILKYNPVVTICLKPLPSYPFPNYATLVRGSIIDSSNIPAVDANISVPRQDIPSQNRIITKSNQNGEFVLYFSNITTNEKISILITKNSNHKSIDTNLEEGMTKYLGKIVFP